MSIRNSGFKDWFPAIAADDRGLVHIIWNAAELPDQVPDAMGLLNYMRWNGQSWTAQNDIATDWAGAALRSSLTVDANGRLHMIYLGYGRLDTDRKGLGTQAPHDLWYTSADGAHAESVSAWTPPKRMTRSRLGYFSDIAVDSRGVVHVLWTESDSQGRWGIFYSQSADGGVTWSERLAMEDDRLVWWYRAHLVVDTQDRLHATWELVSNDQGGESFGFGTTAGAVYALSTDGGMSWTKSHFNGPVLNPRVRDNVTPGPGPQQPAVGVDGNGTVVLVYREPTTNRILYRRSVEGSRWTDPRPVPGIAAGIARPFDIYDMAVDSAGQLHLVAVGLPSGSDKMALLHSTWDRHGWSAPDVIMSGPLYPEYPRISVGGGNRLHVVWFVGDRVTNRTPLAIQYSTAVLPLPSTRLRGAAPVPSFAKVPIPTPVVEPLRPGVDIPPPPANIVASAAPTLPDWQTRLLNMPLFPLVLSTVPIVVLLVLFVGFRLFTDHESYSTGRR